MIREDTKSEIEPKASGTDPVLRPPVVADAPKAGETAIFEEVWVP